MLANEVQKHPARFLWGFDTWSWENSYKNGIVTSHSFFWVLGFYMPCLALEGVEKQSPGGERTVPQDPWAAALPLQGSAVLLRSGIMEWLKLWHLRVISWPCCSLLQAVAKLELFHGFGIVASWLDKPRGVCSPPFCAHPPCGALRSSARLRFVVNAHSEDVDCRHGLCASFVWTVSRQKWLGLW